MKVMLSDFSLYKWYDTSVMIHFAEKSVIEAGNTTVKWWLDFEKDKYVYELDYLPHDIPIAGVIWDVIEE